MKYFNSRAQAGQTLAAQLVEKYRYEDCAVIAVSDGAVQVGEQIASELHCVLTMLISEDIDIPGESLKFGSMAQTGNFVYNSQLAAGEADEYTAEFHGYLEEAKRSAFNTLNRLLGDGGIINRELLRNRNIIVVSDGMDDVIMLDMVLDFIKPIHVTKLIIATPVIAVGVVDKLHMYADELHILDVKENYLGVDHYYEVNDVPNHEDTVKKINQIILNWK